MGTKWKIGLILVTIALILSLTLYQSYALWIENLSGRENIVKVGCFDIKIDEKTSSISLNNTYPMSDQKGLSQTPYTITITNTCEGTPTPLNYLVTLNTLTTNTMANSKVKFAFSEGNVIPTTGTNLATFAATPANVNTETNELQIANLDKSLIMTTGTLKANESATYNLYLWIDESAGNEVQGQKFSASVNTIAVPTTITYTLASDAITTLATTDATNFSTDADGSIRYIGNNPDNYVSFNGELWRIIGVMKGVKSNVEDTSGETRLKLIRKEPHPTYNTWDTNDSNNWSSSSLQSDLNETYLTSFTSDALNLIGNAVWNLGGIKSSDITTSDFYKAERSTTVYEGNLSKWSGKVGLIYPSDYGYATSGGETTDRTTCLASTLMNWGTYEDCYNNDWLYSSYSQWTITPYSSDGTYVSYIDITGGIDSEYMDFLSTQNLQSASNSKSVFPVVYLNANVKMISGTGIETDPYILGI